jgi:hypothetical protein
MRSGFPHPQKTADFNNETGALAANERPKACWLA